MKFSAAFVAAYLAATATALPVSDTTAPAQEARAMHIIEKVPVPERREDRTPESLQETELGGPGFAVPKHEAVAADADSPADDSVNDVDTKSAWGMPIVYHVPYPYKREAEAEAETASEEEEAGGVNLETRRRHRPVVNHRPVDRRGEEAGASAGGAEAEASAGNADAKEFWGMPIINHIPVPGYKRGEQSK